MNLFLHIIISEKTPEISFAVSNWVKKTLPNITYYSVDNHSEALVVETGVKALKEAEKAFLFIECEEEDPGKTFRLIKEASKRKGALDLEIFCEGKNQKIEVLSKAFTNKWTTEGEMKKVAVRFFKGQA